jgi:hypothetical protein
LLLVEGGRCWVPIGLHQQDPNEYKDNLRIVACSRLRVRIRGAVQGAELSPGTLNKPSRERRAIGNGSADRRLLRTR